MPCVNLALGPAQPLAVQQVRSRELDLRAAALQLTDRVLVCVLRTVASLNQGRTAGTHSKRPRRARGERPLGEGAESREGFAAAIRPAGCLDQLGQGRLRGERRIVVDDGRPGADRRVVVSLELAGYRHYGAADICGPALATRCGLP